MILQLRKEIIFPKEIPNSIYVERKRLNIPKSRLKVSPTTSLSKLIYFGCRDSWKII